MNNIMYGYDGDDTMDGGIGNDTLYGNEGNDTIYGYEGDDTIDGGSGADTLDGGKGTDTLYGNDGNDTIYGYDGDDYIDGGSGDDILDGRFDNTYDMNYSMGNDTLLGGEGNDTLSGGNGTDTLSGGEGNDTLDAGWSGNDILNGGSGDDFIKGNGGNNTLISEKGNDFIYGGNGNDIYVFRIGDGADKISDIGGTDTIRLISNNFNINSICSKYLNDDVVINFKDNLTDSITIVNGKLYDNNKIEIIEIMDENNNIVYTSPLTNIVNVAPIIKSITPITTIEDTMAISGTITAIDVDSINLTYSTTAIVDGFTLNSYGTYSFNPYHSSYQSLKAGEIKNITIPITVSDGSLSDTKDLVITITGTNDKPIINSITPINAKEDDAIVNGKIIATDADCTNLTYSTTFSVDGFIFNSDGTYSFNPAHSSYQSLKQGERRDITIQVVVSDGSLTDSKYLVVIVLTGTNDKPIIDSITPISTREDALIVYGKIYATDEDNMALTCSTTAVIDGFTLNRDGTYSFNPAHSAYQSLKQGEIKTITIPVSVSDGSLTDSKDLIITIIGADEKPIINSVMFISTTEDATLITGTITATDVDSSTLTYSTIVTIDGFTLNTNGTYSFNPVHSSYQSLKAGEVKTITIPVSVSDGSLSDLKDLVITITGTNDVPTVLTAIDNYTFTNSTIQSGSVGASDIDKDILSYTVSTTPNNGTITIDTSGNWRYTAKSNYAGFDKAIVTISDRKGGSVTKTLNFNVQSNEIANNITTTASMKVGDNFESIIDIANDQDWVKINLQSGKTYDVNLAGITLRDTYLRGIYDKNGILISGTQNDDSNGTSNSYVLLKASYAGEYYISAGAYSLYNTGTYKLDVQEVNSSVITGSYSNDNLIGTITNNTIHALLGDDTITGNKGNDRLYGESGNDTYKFVINDGIDTIYDYSGIDNILFDSTISKSNIAFYLQGSNDLAIQYSTNDLITVSTWSNTPNKIEKVQLSDGNYLTSTDIDKLIQSMSAYSTSKGISLSSVDSVSKNADLMTMIASSWHK